MTSCLTRKPGCLAVVRICTRAWNAWSLRDGAGRFPGRCALRDRSA